MFEAVAGTLSEMDVLLSFANLATSCPVPYVRPDITPSVRILQWFLSISYKHVV